MSHTDSAASDQRPFAARASSCRRYVAAIGLLAAVCLFQSCARNGRGAEPPLPDLEINSFLPSIRQQIGEAFRDARANPGDPEAVGKLGMSLHAHEQYATAEAAYRRAEWLAPNSFNWPYYLAIVQSARGEMDTALASIERALRVDPENVPARHLKAELLIGKSRWQEAKEILTQILEQNPVQAKAHYNMGRVQLGLEQSEEAIVSLQKACEYFPSYGAAHFALASAFRRNGDRGQASRHLRASEMYKGIDAPLYDPLWEKVADLNMGPLAHLRRAIFLDSKGDLASAAAANQKALELDPGLVQAHVNLVSLYGRLGDHAKAEAHFREGLTLNPNRDDLYYNYGVLRFHQGKNRDAKIAFERALAINPYNGQAQTNVGYILQTEGRLPESKAMLEKAVQNAPNSRLAHFHLARLLIHFNKVSEGIEHLELTLAPEDDQTPTYLYALAAAHARLKNKAKALEYAYQAREGATARGQSQLLASIQRDIRRLEQASP